MATTERPPGKTTIAPGVLITIIRLAALQVEGVQHMAQVPSSMEKLFSKGRDQGVQISIEEDGHVNADIHVVLFGKANLRETAKKIQEATSVAISKMIGMEVGAINIHIEDVVYGETSPAQE